MRHVKSVGVRNRYFKCPKCGTVSRATKRADKMTAIGHRKTMWCWRCKRVMPHIQISK